METKERLLRFSIELLQAKDKANSINDVFDRCDELDTILENAIKELQAWSKE